jgi:hypothetical protein
MLMEIWVASPGLADSMNEILNPTSNLNDQLLVVQMPRFYYPSSSWLLITLHDFLFNMLNSYAYIPSSVS